MDQVFVLEEVDRVKRAPNEKAEIPRPSSGPAIE